jgi:magnesium-transporting ATPase (P-type)
MKASLSVNFERFTLEGLSYNPGNVKLCESPGRAGGLPWINYLTFGVLLLILQATTDQFRTGWFIESVISASVTVLVIRTRRSFFRSKLGKYLLTATLLTVAVAIIINQG